MNQAKKKINKETKDREVPLIAPVLVLSQGEFSFLREAPEAFKFLRHVIESNLSVRPKCSHRCVSLKEFPSEPVLISQECDQNIQPSKPLQERNCFFISRFTVRFTKFTGRKCFFGVILRKLITDLGGGNNYLR